MAFRVLNIIVLLFAVNLVLCGALFPTQLIYQFPLGTFVENIAARKDGSLLVSLVSAPEVYLIQPSAADPDPQLVYRFENYTTNLGITEISPDTFIVVTTKVSGPAMPIPGAGALFQIKFTGNKAKVTLKAKLTDVTFPNGVATLNKRKVLLADSANGVVFVVNLKTGISSVAIRDPLLEPLSSRPELPLGVNGVRIRGDTLYFTNSAQALLGRIPIDRKTGKAKGPATKIVNALPPGLGYDDFALSKKGDAAYPTNAAGNFIERVDLASKQQTIVAGDINSTEIAGPTSAAFGRNGNEKTLFVTTSGGQVFPVNGNITVGGQVVAIYLGGKHGGKY